VNNNHLSTNIVGNSNVIGSGNVVNSHQEEHHHHHHYEKPKKTAGENENGSDMVAVLIGISFMVAWASWQFIRNADMVYLAIFGAWSVSLFPVAFTAIKIYNGEYAADTNIVATIACTAGSIFGIFLTYQGFQGLSPAIIQFGHESTGAMHFWNGLTDHGHGMVLRNLAGCILISFTATCIFLMNISVLLNFSSIQKYIPSVILKFFNRFRPLPGGVACIFMLLFGWAFQSGYAFSVLGIFTQ
jgi:hypothetical protein